MAAHKYWRVTFGDSQGGVYTQLSEIAFLAADDTDLTIGGTAFASSFYGGGYEVARAVDKSPSTDWCSAGGSFPNRFWYEFPASVEPARLKIICGSSAAWAPRAASSLDLSFSDDGLTWSPDRTFALSILSGSFSGGATVVLAIGAYVPPVIRSLLVGSLSGDYRFVPPATGTIATNNRVMVKAGPETPETPMAGARVRLHRMIDGYCAWEGLSDAAGYYHASGLEVGLTYIPVAIDLSGTYECVAAGPVVAVKAP